MVRFRRWPATLGVVVLLGGSQFVIGLPEAFAQDDERPSWASSEYGPCGWAVQTMDLLEAFQHPEWVCPVSWFRQFQSAIGPEADIVPASVPGPSRSVGDSSASGSASPVRSSSAFALQTAGRYLRAISSAAESLVGQDVQGVQRPLLWRDFNWRVAVLENYGTLRVSGGLLADLVPTVGGTSDLRAALADVARDAQQLGEANRTLNFFPGPTFNGPSPRLDDRAAQVARKANQAADAVQDYMRRNP